MSITSKKLVSAALTATTLLWAVGVAALPLAANAQTTADLQAQIAALLAQIQQLQSQLNASGSSTSMTSCYTFTSNLTIGSTGAQVSNLQQVLISAGDLTAVSAPTGYFGTLTQSALAKYQAAHGIKPSSGYFGPITRSYLASNCVGTSTGTGTGTGTGTTAPATGLSVSLASDNPAAGSLISSANSGSARVPVLAVNFTAGNSGAVTLSSVSFQKTGVLSDSAISGAYLIQNGQVVAQYTSLNQGLITFSGMNLSIPAGQTVELQLGIDVSGGLSAGNTTGFALESASAISAFNSSNVAVTPTGSFPLNGNTFTVTQVTNPSLATVTIASSSYGTSVTAGTQGNIVGAWTVTVNNSPVWLKNINFHVIGSANMANIQNVKLLVNGTQVGATLSAVPSNNMADFNLTTPAQLNTGTNNVQVVADVMGSPSMYFQFELLNGYDVLAVDSQYNVPVQITNNTLPAPQVNIQQGQITLNQDANTPTGNVSKVSGATLAKFDIYAAGEPVKVKFLDFNIQLTGVVTSTNALDLNNQIQNVQLVDDAGNQVGTTINQPPSATACSDPQNPHSYQAITGGTNAGAAVITSSTVSYEDCFGSASSPINYIVPANTTRVLTLKADIQSTANFSNITANLSSGEASNLQGMTSSQVTQSSGVSGVALSLVSSSLTPAVNNALGTQNISAGTTNVKIGSYSLSASSAEGVNVNTLSVELTPGTTTAAFQNLKLMVNGVQFGTTQGVVSGNTVYAFSGSPINVPAGQTVNVDVYADTLSAATGTFTPATELIGYTGSGASSYTSVSATPDLSGQAIAFNGQPALTVAADSSNPPAGYITQNSTGNTLAVYRFSETSNVENVKVTQLNVVDVASSSVKAAYSNVSLWNGSTLLGTAAAPGSWNATYGGYVYTFNSFTNPLIVPQGNSVSLTLKGDAGSYTAGSITDNSTSTFTIATTTGMQAYGATSNKPATVTLSNATGNAQTILRSTETVSGSSVSSLPPASLQQIGSITLTSNAAGDTEPSHLMLTFNSAASSSPFLSTVILKDQSGNNIVSVDHFATSSYATGTTPTVTWTFSTSTPLAITGGSSYTLTLWGDLSQIPAISQAAQSLTASILATGDYQYYDSTNWTSGTPALVSLPANQVPITVVSLTTPVGGQF